MDEWVTEHDLWKGWGGVRTGAMRRLGVPAAAIAVVLLAGCGVPEPGEARSAPGPASGSPASPGVDGGIRHDDGPVRARFPELGDFLQVTWKASILGVEDSRVPGPTDVRMSGVVRLAGEDGERLRQEHEWGPAPTGPDVVEGLAKHVPDSASWQVSRDFEQSAVNSSSFHVDFSRNVLVFDAVNPDRVSP